MIKRHEEISNQTNKRIAGGYNAIGHPGQCKEGSLDNHQRRNIRKSRGAKVKQQEGRKEDNGTNMYRKITLLGAPHVDSTTEAASFR